MAIVYSLLSIVSAIITTTDVIFVLGMGSPYFRLAKIFNRVATEIHSLPKEVVCQLTDCFSEVRVTRLTTTNFVIFSASHGLTCRLSV